MANITADKIMKRILGEMSSFSAQSNSISLASETDTDSSSASSNSTSSSSSYEEAARIVQTLLDGGRAKRVESLEVLKEVPEGGVTLPVVAGGVLKTMNTDTIMAQLNKNFEKELNKLVIGQVPIITDEEIDDITTDNNE